MAPKKIWNVEVANENDLIVNGYEYVELNGKHFVENGNYDHVGWFYSLMDKMNEKYPQFRKLTDSLVYIDGEFRRGFNRYSSSLDAMSMLIADTYERKNLSKEEVHQNILWNLKNDLERMSLNTNNCDPEVLQMIEQYRENPTDEFIDYVYDMFSQANKYAKSYGISSVNREETENTNARCFAMVGMADMIGMGHMVPRVEKAQIWHNGKVIREGIVYEHNSQHMMQRSDIEYLTAKGSGNKYPQDNPKTLENISDINVMFWLSGRNPLYVTDLGYDIDPLDGSVKFRFSSFESPEDFGTYPEDKKAEADRGIDKVTMISRKTAERIAAVDPAAYRRMLTSSGISAESVNAGAERLEALQAKIRENRLEIVDDWQAQWERTGLKVLSDGTDEVQALGGIYTSIYHPDETIGQVRLGRKPEPKQAGVVEYCRSYMSELSEAQVERIHLLGDGDERLGFYMLNMAATPASGIYPGPGRIRASRIQSNLISLLEDEIETVDTLKLQILREEAKAKMKEMDMLPPSERNKFEKKLVKAAELIQSAEPDEYIKGSSVKWPREKTPIELQAENDVKNLKIVVYHRERNLDAENIRRSYEAMRNLEGQILETLSFFSWDSKAFKTLSALASLDLKDNRERSLEEMQYHVQVMSELAVDYTAQYPTAEQQNKNARRARRIDLTNRIRAVGEACLANRDPRGILNDNVNYVSDTGAEPLDKSDFAEVNEAEKSLTFSGPGI